MHSLRLVAMTVVIVAVTPWVTHSAAIAAESSIGFVLDLGGTWTLKNATLQGAKPTRLAGGDQLPAGGEIQPENADGKSFIVVCLFTGDTERYVAATKLPVHKSDGRIERVLRGIQGHYHGQLVHAISRGDDPADGVVRATAEGWNLAPVLGSLRAGTYIVRAASAPPDEGASPASYDATIDWNPAKPTPARFGDLGPGLYRMQLLNLRSKEPIGYEATILVCPAEDYAEQVEAYDKVVKITQGWDAETRKRKGGDFLRAYLETAASTL